MSTSAAQIKKALTARASIERRTASMWFFKTGKGQYGEGDVFIGVSVPDQRMVARQFADVELPVLAQLLGSKIHEHRLTALIILVGQYAALEKKAMTQKKTAQKKLYDFYLAAAHKNQVNNWDLVDTSAHKIVGAYLYEHGGWKTVLSQLARSKNMWEQRIAVIACAAFIQRGAPEQIMYIADMLLEHPHDLLHKAVGWMLREMGKKNGAPALEAYLKTRYHRMPRTTLRYAIEKLSEKRRKQYLQGKI